MQTAPKTNRLQAVLDALRPSPTEFAGFVTGGTIGAYVAGPMGAAIGMFVGAIAFYQAERVIDRSTHAPDGQPPARDQNPAA